MKSPAHFIPDGLRKMGFPKADTSIYNQWIEGISPWLFRDSLSCPAGYPVTVTFDKDVKSIHRIQL